MSYTASQQKQLKRVIVTSCSSLYLGGLGHHSAFELGKRFHTSGESFLHPTTEKRRKLVPYRTYKKMERTSNVETFKDLSNWMRDLPEKAKAKPLSQICLPGSHDSFTYSLERGSGAGKA